MTTTHRFRIIALAAILFSICANGRAATSWVQGFSYAGTTINSPYYNQTGNLWWTWTNSGSLTASKTTTQLQAVASNFDALADANGSVSGGGTKEIFETGTAQAYSTWNWTGSPGAATSIAIHSVQSLAKRSGATWGSLSIAYAYAPSANTSADAYASTSISGTTDYSNGSGTYTVQDESGVFTSASESDVANYMTYSHDLGSGNASLSNYDQDFDGSFTYAYTDYSISINHSYTTATGLSSIWCSAAISFYCDAGVDFSGTPAMFGVIPGAEATAQVSINGSATMDLTF